MEPINVLVKFSLHKVEPLVFSRGGRTYKIDKVNFVHHYREGAQTIFVFHVSDKANTYKLKLETETLRWGIEE